MIISWQWYYIENTVSYNGRLIGYIAIEWDITYDLDWPWRSLQLLETFQNGIVWKMSYMLTGICLKTIRKSYNTCNFDCDNQYKLNDFWRSQARLIYGKVVIYSKWFTTYIITCTSDIAQMNSWSVTTVQVDFGSLKMAVENVVLYCCIGCWKWCTKVPTI